MRDHVGTWLLACQARSEDVQQRLLRRQAVALEGRKHAYQLLHTSIYELGTGIAEANQLDTALDFFRERVADSVETAIGGQATSNAGLLEAAVRRAQESQNDMGGSV